MAINFPSTAGQATDGSYTYNVAGIIYAWNGSSWSAAGAGASATDRTLFSVTNASAGSTSLSYNNTNGIFTYVPPDLSGYLTAEADTLDSVTGRGAQTNNALTLGDVSNGGDLNISAGNNNYLKIFAGSNEAYIRNIDNNGGAGGGGLNIAARTTLGLYSGGSGGSYITFVGSSTGTAGLYYQSLKKLETSSTGVTITGALTAGGLTYPNTNGTSGDVLASDGAGNVTWTTPSGLQSRTTVSTSGSVANGGVLNTTFTTPKTYALLKIETSHQAWVTLYSSSTARSNDSTRLETTDPTPGSGVLSEVITSGAITQSITPGTICFNESASNITYAKIVNKSGSTALMSVTLTFVQLEV
jgi:hypothetical protein